MFVVVSYDITDDAKRKKVAEILKDYGIRVQYSVFQCNIEKKYVENMIEEVTKFLDNETDSLRIYYLCNECQKKLNIFGKNDVIENDSNVVI